VGDDKPTEKSGVVIVVGVISACRNVSVALFDDHVRGCREQIRVIRHSMSVRIIPEDDRVRQAIGKKAQQRCNHWSG
jgi:hypothetical protein